MKLVEKLQEYIIKENLIPIPTSKILCCVSGGPDSMVLCNLLMEAGYTIAIAHCNFNLRADESDGDQKLVEQFALLRDVTLHTISFDTLEYAKEGGISIQMAARELRYSWFEQLAEKFNYQHIAIAHNRGDNIEGFFINLTRGCGIRGLNGMKNAIGKIIRPLMFASRAEIELYAKDNGVPYRTDSSNLKTKYIRNKIRIDILPQFREISPQFDTVMEQNIDKINESVELLDLIIDKIAEKCVTQSNRTTTIDLKVLQGYPKWDFILYHLLSPKGFNRDICCEIARGVTKSGLSFNSREYKAIINRNSLVIQKIIDIPKTDYLVTINNSDEVISGFKIYTTSVDQSDFKSNRELSRAFFDTDKLQYPLTVREWREGDKFSPLGMRGVKKISDFLIDKKLSLFEKERQRVVVDRNGVIIWVVNQRVSSNAAIDLGVTKSVTIIEYTPTR